MTTRDIAVLEFDVSPAGRRTNSFSVAQGTVRLTLEDDTERLINVPNRVARLLMAAETVPSTLEEAQGLIAKSSLAAAQTRIMELQATRDHSARELRDRLIRDGYDQELTKQVVDEAVVTKVCSDARFAEAFVHAKVRAGWGQGRIERELKRHGIDARTLPGWPHEYTSDESEYERALEAASRKRVREPNAYAKLVRFLCGRGFSQAVSMRAAKEVLGDD